MIVTTILVVVVALLMRIEIMQLLTTLIMIHINIEHAQCCYHDSGHLESVEDYARYITRAFEKRKALVFRRREESEREGAREREPRIIGIQTTSHDRNAKGSQAPGRCQQ